MAKPFKCSPLRDRQFYFEIKAISIWNWGNFNKGNFPTDCWGLWIRSRGRKKQQQWWEWNTRLDLDCRTQATFGYKEVNFSDDNFKPVDWKILVTQSVAVLQILCRHEYISPAFVTSSYGLHTHLNSCTRWAVMRAPEAPKGWPIAMAPPLTLVFSGSRPSTFSTARYWGANASFT